MGIKERETEEVVQRRKIERDHSEIFVEKEPMQKERKKTVKTKKTGMKETKRKKTKREEKI